MNYHGTFAVMLLVALLVPPGLVYADALLPDAHGPIGVMREHTHAAGEWMLAYRYMYMDMGGNRIGTRRVSVAGTAMQRNRFGTLRIVPTRMSMEMHMFGAMYAVSDRLTLMAMGNWQQRDMDHRVFLATGTEETFKVRTSGIGDTRLSLMHGLYKSSTARAHINMGVRLPTGSITERHQIINPMGGMPTVRVPYAMQLGTGTFDLLPGVSCAWRKGKVGWGMQYDAQLRMGTNDENYALGDEHELTTWASYRVQPWLSASLRLKGHYQGRIQGMDPSTRGVVQTADPANYGGRRLDLLAGFNLAGGPGMLHSHRVAVEAGWPLYQDLNGLQMETDLTVTAGWQYAWGGTEH